jgi:hypothetical protein
MTKTEQHRRGRAPRIGWLVRPAGALAAASIWFAGCSSDDNAGFPTDNSGLMPGQAQGKFCHDLVLNGAKTELIFEIGTPTLVRFTALTYTCSPSLGSPCTVLPVGYLPARLIAGTTVLSSGGIRIGPGGKYFYRARISDHPTVMTIPLDQPVSCEANEIDFSDGGAPSDGAMADGGASDSAGPDGGTDAMDAAASPDVAQQLGDDAGNDAAADLAAELDAAPPDAASSSSAD